LKESWLFAEQRGGPDKAKGSPPRSWGKKRFYRKRINWRDGLPTRQKGDSSWGERGKTRAHVPSKRSLEKHGVTSKTLLLERECSMRVSTEGERDVHVGN